MGNQTQGIGQGDSDSQSQQGAAPNQATGSSDITTRNGLPSWVWSLALLLAVAAGFFFYNQKSTPKAPPTATKIDHAQLDSAFMVMPSAARRVTIDPKTREIIYSPDFLRQMEKWLGILRQHTLLGEYSQENERQNHLDAARSDCEGKHNPFIVPAYRPGIVRAMSVERTKLFQKYWQSSGGKIPLDELIKVLRKLLCQEVPCDKWSKQDLIKCLSKHFAEVKIALELNPNALDCN